MASTCRSHQSFAAWLMPQTIGPARITPRITASQWPDGETPAETAPHRYAHIGGNHVIGFNRVRTARGSGRDLDVDGGVRSVVTLMTVRIA
jgi:hypothetical protein